MLLSAWTWVREKKNREEEKKKHTDAGYCPQEKYCNLRWTRMCFLFPLLRREEQVDFYGHCIFIFIFICFYSIYFMLHVLVFPLKDKGNLVANNSWAFQPTFSLGTMSALIKNRSSLLSAQCRTHKVSWQCEKLEGLVSCFFFCFFFLV